jgi:hypothetical protein
MKPIFLLILAAFSINTARAEYFTVREIETQCRKSGRKTLKGLGVGAVIGCGVGMLLSRRHEGRACAQGAKVGGATGALIGFASSCEDQVRYVTYWDNGLDAYPVDVEYVSWGRGVRGRVVFEGYHREYGYVCREYETYIETPDGEEYRRSVACKERGHWRHGYSRKVVSVTKVKRVQEDELEDEEYQGDDEGPVDDEEEDVESAH